MNISMQKFQTALDKGAIGLSLLCTVHCLLLPAALILAPSTLTTLMSDERFHWLMIFIVIPISAVALTMGCKQHQRHRVLLLGLIGITLLVLAVLLGEDVIGEISEKVLTVIGAGFVAMGHLNNYRLCKQAGCACASQLHPNN